MAGHDNARAQHEGLKEELLRQAFLYEDPAAYEAGVQAAMAALLGDAPAPEQPRLPTAQPVIRQAQ